jgi:hypothetical protein
VSLGYRPYSRAHARARQQGMVECSRDLGDMFVRYVPRAPEARIHAICANDTSEATACSRQRNMCVLKRLSQQECISACAILSVHTSGLLAHVASSINCRAKRTSHTPGRLWGNGASLIARMCVYCSIACRVHVRCRMCVRVHSPCVALIACRLW